MRCVLISIYLSSMIWVYAEKPGHAINNGIKTFIGKYCLDCHGTEKQKGDVQLNTLSSFIDNNATAQLWQDTLDVLNTGDMPPKKAKLKPTDDELAKAVGQLTEDLLKAKRILTDKGGETVIRRLTKKEYINSIKEITGIKLPDHLVPDDENGNSFNTIGANQYFSPSLVTRYMELGEVALSKILLDGQAKHHKKRKLHRDLTNHIRKSLEKDLATRTAKYEKALLVMNKNEDYKKHGFKDKLDAKHTVQNQEGITTLQKHYLTHESSKTGMLLMHRAHEKENISVKADFRGKYTFRLRVAAEKGMSEERRFIEINQGDNLLGYYHVHGTLEKPQIIEIQVSPKIDVKNLNITIKGKDNNRLPKTWHQGRQTKQILKGETIHSIWVDWLELEGPFYTGEYTQKKQEILSGVNLNKTSQEELVSLFRNFSQKAFRGAPISTDYLAHLVEVYQQEVPFKKTKIEALIKPLAIILSSPDFLFLSENKNSQKRLSGRELATRLSYTLWKTPPNAKLLECGEALTQDKDLLKNKITEMTKDPRFNAFVEEYFGQWLHMVKYDSLTFDTKQFPYFDGGLILSARQEVFAFIKNIIDEDLSLSHLIDSDFTMVNSMMADYYGFPKQKGDKFTKYFLKPEERHRGGLLGKVAIQALGSTGDRTSPVERGAFILRKFLHSPPPPPPPNVPQLDTKVKKLTIKQQLAKHNEIPQCRSCHRKMDPLGLAMENFSTIGKWRDKIGKHSIDLKGQMPDGTHFANFTDMKQELMARKEKMIESMIEALIKYGLGREQEFSDQDFIQSLLKVSKENEYKFKPLLIAFLSSDQFLGKQHE